MIAGSKLEIVGKRLLLVYDPQKNAFLDFFQQDNTALRKSVGEKGYRKLRDKQQVEISLTRPQGFDETSARAAMAKIFLGR